VTASGEGHADKAQRLATDRTLEVDDSDPAADVRMNSSTLLRELSITTTPAASAITSLFCSIVMPTVAAIMAGASLMPSLS
jgi:hypothetical protein